MSKREALVPTVITNKNGIVTTVYRKPVAAVKTLPTVALTQKQRAYALKKKLIKRIDSYGELSYRYNMHRRKIDRAVAAEDVVFLERMDRYFNANLDGLLDTFEAVRIAGMDRNDDVLFDQVYTFEGLSPEYASGPRLAEFIPLLLEHPEKTERIAHARNLIATYEHIPTLEEVTDALKVPLAPSTVLPAHLAASITPSATPVTDRRLVYTTLSGMEEKYAYNYMKDWDEQTVTYIAEAIRSNILSTERANIVSVHATPHAAVERTALLWSVRDLLRESPGESSKELFSANGMNLAVAIDNLRALTHGPSVVNPIPIDTDEGLQSYAALLRFSLTVNKDRYLTAKLMVDTDSPRRSNDSSDRFDRELIELVKRRSTVRETQLIVSMVNERGETDPVALEALLDETDSASLSSGWL